MKSNQQRDVTQGSLASNIAGLAWPIIASQTLSSFPNVYDTLWLGQISRDAQAAAGLTMAVRFVMISVLIGLSIGSGAVVSRYVGAKEQDKANLAVLQAVILMIAASGVLGLVGIIFARPLLTLVGADSATLPLALRYSRIIFAGLITMEMVPSVGAMLNAAGAPQVMLGMTLLSAGTLLVGEPLLVKWMGIEGAALALVGSNGIGMLWGLGVLVAGRASVRLDLRNFRLDFPMMRRILRVTLPAILQRGTPHLAAAYLTRLISAYGAPTLAAWVVAKRIADFALIPVMGLTRVASPMVGQNLGAAQPERAARSVNIIARAVMLVAGGIFGALILFAPQVMALFSRDMETISIGTHIARMLSVGYVGVALNFVFESAQGGAGDTFSPMAVNLIAVWIIQVPLAYLLSQTMGFGANGIWLALILGWILQATLMGLRFRQGQWKLKRI